MLVVAALLALVAPPFVVTRVPILPEREIRRIVPLSTAVALAFTEGADKSTDLFAISPGAPPLLLGNMPGEARFGPDDPGAIVVGPSLALVEVAGVVYAASYTAISAAPRLRALGAVGADGDILVNDTTIAVADKAGVRVFDDNPPRLTLLPAF
ncbi:MAG TPA: hypothetical protein VGO62_13360, partial [Myxococcota bacterium]